MKDINRNEWLKDVRDRLDNALRSVKQITSNIEKDYAHLEKMEELVRKHRGSFPDNFYQVKPGVNNVSEHFLPRIEENINNLSQAAHKLVQYEIIVSQAFMRISPEIQKDLDNLQQKAQQIQERDKSS